MMLRLATRAVPRLGARRAACVLPRALHTTRPARGTTTLPNILAGGPAPAVVVRTLTPRGLQLDDGLIIPGACVFLDGEVLLWDAPSPGEWGALGVDALRARFELFEAVAPRPEVLLIGTGSKVEMLPPAVRAYLNGLGIQVDVMDTWNACSTYNILSEEGRRVAAALLPHTPHSWTKQ